MERSVFYGSIAAVTPVFLKKSFATQFPAMNLQKVYQTNSGCVCFVSDGRRLRPVSRYWCTTIQESKPWTLRETVTALPLGPPFPFSLSLPRLINIGHFVRTSHAMAAGEKRRGEGTIDEGKKSQKTDGRNIVRCTQYSVIHAGEKVSAILFPGFICTYGREKMNIASLPAPLPSKPYIPSSPLARKM